LQIYRRERSAGFEMSVSSSFTKRRSEDLFLLAALEALPMTDNEILIGKCVAKSGSGNIVFEKSPKSLLLAHENVRFS
jgi:hypothetical protein